MRDANRLLKRRHKSSVVGTTVKSLDNAELVPGLKKSLFGNVFNDCKFQLLTLAAIMAAAFGTRLLFIQSLPQGAYIDEVFTLRNTLSLLHRPFDPFGTTPLIKEGWVVTPNLYLYWNLLIVRLFGVSYLSLKLFSVIPGILGCLFFYFSCTRIFAPRMAFLVSLLFVFSHWHIRLSRYGWDNSFMVMMFTASVWLLLRALDGKRLSAFMAGTASGIGMYSYIASVLCCSSIFAYLGLEILRSRMRKDIKRLAAFGLGVAVTATPLLAHYLRHPAESLVRVQELTASSATNPASVILGNILHHALMFHVKGGTYARDNYPGLPMLDVISGILMGAGLIVAVRERRNPKVRLVLVLLAMNFLGGILSISQEGANVYRVSATVVPAILLVGLGIQGVSDTATRILRDHSRHLHYSRLIMGLIVFAAILFNLYDYFHLERGNISAMRVMGFEHRVVGQAIHSVDVPVYLVVPGILSKLPDHPMPGERYFEVNRNFPYQVFGQTISALAILYFSGRYQPQLSVSENFRAARIFPISRPEELKFMSRPAAVIFHSSETAMLEALRSLGATEPVRIEYPEAIRGHPVLGVARIGSSPNIAPRQANSDVSPDDASQFMDMKNPLEMVKRVMGQ